MEPVTSTTTALALATLGIGIALAGAPGPVQAVLLAEAVRGGISRGLRALAGVHLTFGLLMLGLALGVSVGTPHGVALRILKVAGGALLLWLAADGLRSKRQADHAPNGRRSLPPEVRGALSILFNPGAWLFLGAVASPLLASAALQGGMGGALLAAAALIAGTALGDAVLVMLGGIGLRRASAPVVRSVRIALAVILAGLGVWLVISGAVL